ncbi:MAG: lysophospholipid acyltransferase family protein [Bacteroidota bacterium]
MRKLILGFTYLIVVRIFLRVIVGVKLIRKEALKKQKQFIIVSNHNSHIDTMALMSSLSFNQLPKTHPVAAGDYFGGSPIKAFFSKLFTNAILIRRTKDGGSENPIEQMSQALIEGKSLILFPEGSRGEPEKMQIFKKGIGVLLQKHPNVHYLPVYMSGMGKVLPKGEKLLVPFDSYVLFGEPTLCKSSDVTEIVNEIESNILELKEQFIASIREN